ncbi:MAG TPA: hypothetical protein VGE07_31340 [Herpetosiphonaceae bacterium]
MATIMLIETNPATRQSVRAILGGAGHDLVLASSWREAGQLLRDRPIDLVLGNNALVPASRGGPPLILLDAACAARSCDPGSYTALLSTPVSAPALLSLVSRVLRDPALGCRPAERCRAAGEPA